MAAYERLLGGGFGIGEIVMVEREWLTCNGPKKMFQFIKGRASPRQLRLLGCGCCRHYWHLHTDERDRTMVEVAERYADGIATEEELIDASGILELEQAAMASEEGTCLEATNNPDDPYPDDCFAAAAVFVKGERENDLIVSGAPYAKRVVLANLIRCIFTNPFRPKPNIEPSWLTCNGGTVKILAQGIYEDRTFTDLPILADTLEQAGCTSQDILSHLRGPGPHCRGCWALDLVLGKE